MRRAGYDATHVAELGMANAKDRDFSLLRAAKQQGPIVLWIRVGNIDNRTLIRQLLGCMPQIAEAVARGEAVIEFVGN